MDRPADPVTGLAVKLSPIDAMAPPPLGIDTAGEAMRKSSGRRPSGVVPPVGSRPRVPGRWGCPGVFIR